MWTNEIPDTLLIVSSFMRTFAVLCTIFAIHEVVQHGLCVRKVSKFVRTTLYLTIIFMCSSIVSLMLRLHGGESLLILSEFTHISMSIVFIIISFIVIFANTPGKI